MNDYLVGILITPVYPRNKIQFPYRCGLKKYCWRKNRVDTDYVRVVI